MGQYTEYTLRVAPEFKAQIKERLTQLAYPAGPGGSATSPFIEDDAWGNVDPGCKWYRHHDHCLECSSEFPDVEFTLSGLIKDDDCAWSRSYLGGKEL